MHTIIRKFLANDHRYREREKISIQPVLLGWEIVCLDGTEGPGVLKPVLCPMLPAPEAVVEFKDVAKVVFRMF